MTKPQEAFRSMIEKVLLFLKEFIKIWEENKAIEGAVTVIRKDANAIDTNWEVQKFVTKGVGKSKKETRDKLDDDTNIIFSIIRSYAISVKNTILYEKYDQTFSVISQYKDTPVHADMLSVFYLKPRQHVGASFDFVTRIHIPELNKTGCPFKPGMINRVESKYLRKVCGLANVL